MGVFLVLNCCVIDFKVTKLFANSIRVKFFSVSVKAKRTGSAVRRGPEQSFRLKKDNLAIRCTSGVD